MDTRHRHNDAQLRAIPKMKPFEYLFSAIENHLSVLRCVRVSVYSFFVFEIMSRRYRRGPIAICYLSFRAKKLHILLLLLFVCALALTACSKWLSYKCLFRIKCYPPEYNVFEHIKCE